MGPTCVGGCPWQIYALQDKLYNTCKLVSCPRHSLSHVRIYDLMTLKTVNHLLQFSLKYRPNHVLNLYQDATICRKKDQYCARLGSVFLARLGGSLPSVPPFLYYTLWKTCCTNCPRSTATLGSVTPGPEGDERHCWWRDNQQKRRQDPRRKLPEKPKKRWLEIEQARIGFWCIWP